MPPQKSKNDIAWEALFAERDIVRDVDANGLHRITAGDINTKREARLMTKFDHLVNLPQIFAQHALAILPDTRSSYVIGRFDCYAKIEAAQNEVIIQKNLPNWIQSLSTENLYSESTALLCAQHAGLFEDVLEEEVTFTVFGRMSTGEFDFSILATKSGGTVKQALHIDRAQCEIDGGFEGAETFALVEVKNQEVEDFHIRQLYYPYRLWTSKLSKRIVPVFLTYSNEVFTFSVYEFAQMDEYNSIQLVKRKRYQIVPTEIEIADIRHTLTSTQIQPEPQDVPFPQADRFERVIDLLTRLRAAGGTLTQDDITTNYAFDIRQTQYYTNAGRYLGLIDRVQDQTGVSYTLTSLGTQLMRKAPRARNLELVKLILKQSVFRTAVEFYLDNARAPSRDEIVDFMRQARLPCNETTKERRAQSVIGWIRWLIGLTAEA